MNKIMKEQDKNLHNFSGEEFKVMVIKILSELRKRMNGNSENFNKEKI